MRHMLSGWMALSFLSVLACHADPPPKPCPVPNAGATCATVCSRLRALGCQEGTPADDGTPCESICADIEAQYDLNCANGINSCSELDDQCSRK